MAIVHRVGGGGGGGGSEGDYLRAVGEGEDLDGEGVRYRVRPSVGDGSIEVTSLGSGFEVVRYDVSFHGEHRVGFEFPSGHFELECCLDGALRVREGQGGEGTLGAGAVALSPRGAVGGVVSYGGGVRYRAVSVTGTWSGVEAYLAGFGVGAWRDTRAESAARAQYAGRAPGFRGVVRPLEDVFLHRRASPGRRLFLESRVLDALGAVVDELDGPDDERSGARARARAGAEAGVVLAPYEVAALRRVPGILWGARHSPPALAELARACSMSVRRLTTGFRALYGTSVMEHHRRRCLDRAAVLLVETGWTVERVAHEVGYASASNFGYAFRRDRGVSPARFRRAHA
ncbi:helix-turn-helix transcriptional regulator [Streptomyces sp. NPDC048172]|uniref:helix-turn-helix transcriptional regulator n=1 Tax=Streptomyces sp. NPDC048172 TaxID=3365505 RepID=UPI0037108E42